MVTEQGLAGSGRRLGMNGPPEGKQYAKKVKKPPPQIALRVLGMFKMGDIRSSSTLNLSLLN